MNKITALSIALVLALCLAVEAEDGSKVKRLANGKPDLSGVYDAGTVTPVDRPPQFGDNLYLSPEEAKKLEENSAKFWEAADKKSEGGADREHRVPVKGVRKLTADNMVASAFTAPHVTEFLTVDVTRGMKALDRLRRQCDVVKARLAAAETESEVAGVRRELLAFRRRYLAVETTLDFYGDAINTRTNPTLATYLSACDWLACESMRVLLEPLGIKTPPVLTYVDKGEGAVVLQDGRTLCGIAAIVWCTGFRPDFGWLELPVLGLDGYPRHRRGVALDAPGLAFLGMRYQYRFGSALLGGVGEDAAYVVARTVKAARCHGTLALAPRRLEA